MRSSETKYIGCGCHDPEHTIKLTAVEDETYPHLYISVQLNTDNNWYTRLWLAIKYVFGQVPQYGHWETTIIEEEDFDDIQDLISRVRRSFAESFDAEYSFEALSDETVVELQSNSKIKIDEDVYYVDKPVKAGLNESSVFMKKKRE